MVNSIARVESGWGGGWIHSASPNKRDHGPSSQAFSFGGRANFRKLAELPYHLSQAGDLVKFEQRVLYNFEVNEDLRGRGVIVSPLVWVSELPVVPLLSILTAAVFNCASFFSIRSSFVQPRPYSRTTSSLGGLLCVLWAKFYLRGVICSLSPRELLLLDGLIWADLLIFCEF